MPGLIGSRRLASKFLSPVGPLFTGPQNFGAAIDGRTYTGWVPTPGATVTAYLNDVAQPNPVTADVNGYFAYVFTSAPLGNQVVRFATQLLNVPPVTVPARPALGLYPFPDNGQPNNIAAASSWLGAGFDQWILFNRGASATEMRANADAMFTDTQNLAIFAQIPKALYSIGMPSNTTLAQVAAGALDADYTYVFQKIAQRQPTGTIALRLDWEFNLTSFPWASAGKEADYIAAFQRKVTLARAVSNRFEIDWCPNCTQAQQVTRGDGSKYYSTADMSYPGDAYVDVIGMDVYYQPQDAGAYDSNDPTIAFGYFRDGDSSVGKLGLAWQVSFAQAHGKKLTLSEWGVQGVNKAGYVQLMAAWLRNNGYASANYWNSQAGIPCRLDDGSKGTTGTQFVTEFGPALITSAASVTVAVNTAISTQLTSSKPGTWDIAGGANAGLFTLTKTGALSIAGQAAGSYAVTVRVTDERGLTSTQAFSLTSQAAYSFTNTEAQSYVAAMSPAPSEGRKQLIDNFYTALKTTVDSATLLSRLDGLWLFAAHTSQAGRLNVVSRAYGDATLSTNPPTFTTDRGFTGSADATGGAKGVLTGVAGNRSGNKFTQNSASMGVWAVSGAATDSATAGNGTCGIDCLKPNGTATGEGINDYSALGAAVSGIAGLTVANRSTSAARQVYRNGVQIAADTTGSSRAPDANPLIFGYTNAQYPSGVQGAAMFQGGSLTANQQIALYNALNTYMQGVGAA